MPDNDALFAFITEERLRVADFLETLTDEQWTTPSSCGNWSIEDVTGHLLVGPIKGVRGSLPNLWKARFNLNRANDLGAREVAEMGRDAMVATLRDLADSRFKPPGYGADAPLTDVMIHGQDISRPLSIDLGVPAERWQYAMGTATSPLFALFSVRKHLKGLRFEATDIDFSSGEGAEVSGIAKDLAHVMWGRPDAIDALTGAGVKQLRSRLGG